MLHLVELAACGGAVVEHRGEQPLPDRLDPSGIVQALRQAGGQTRAGAGTADDDALLVDAE